MQEERLTVLGFIQTGSVSAADGKNLLAQLSHESGYRSDPLYVKARQRVLAWLSLGPVNTQEAVELLRALNNLADDLSAEAIEPELNTVMPMIESKTVNAKTAVSLLSVLKSLIVADPEASRRRERMEILGLVHVHKLTGISAIELLHALNPHYVPPAAEEKLSEGTPIDDSAFLNLGELHDIGVQITRTIQDEIRRAVPEYSSKAIDRMERERAKEFARQEKERERERRRSEKEREREERQEERRIASAAKREMERMQREEERRRRDEERSSRRAPTPPINRGYDVRSAVLDEVQRVLEAGRKGTQSTAGKVAQVLSAHSPVAEPQPVATSFIEAEMDRLHDCLRALDLSMRLVEQNWVKINQIPAPANFEVLLHTCQASLSSAHQRLAEVSEAKASMEPKLHEADDADQSYANELLEHALVNYQKHVARLHEVEAGVSELIALGTMKHEQDVQQIRSEGDILKDGK